MKPPSKFIVVLSVLVFSIGCDQLLKHVAGTFLQPSPPVSCLNDFVRLQYAENKGIMLSIGASLSAVARFWIFIVAVGLLLMAILVYVLRSRSVDRLQTVSWALIVSGGLGNLFDRITRDGAVIDFISIGFDDVRTAVFNLADALVFAGVFLLLIHSMRKPKKSNMEELHQPTPKEYEDAHGR